LGFLKREKTLNLMLFFFSPKKTNNIYITPNQTTNRTTTIERA
jgi:hypothetical protein